MRILVGSEKGGSGKTTVATNLAVELARRGRDVLLIDTDPQASSRRWADRRIQARDNRPRVHCVERSGDVFDAIRDLSDRYQDVIIDAGGRDSEELRSAMTAAELLLVVLRPSQFDLETVVTMQHLVSLVRTVNRNLIDRVLLTQMPTHRLVRETQDAREALGDIEGITLSPSRIYERKAYRDAVTQGLGVVELPGPGRAEVQVLVEEVMGLLEPGGDSAVSAYDSHAV